MCCGGTSWPDILISFMLLRWPRLRTISIASRADWPWWKSKWLWSRIFLLGYTELYASNIQHTKISLIVWVSFRSNISNITDIAFYKICCRILLQFVKCCNMSNINVWKNIVVKHCIPCLIKLIFFTVLSSQLSMTEI